MDYTTGLTDDEFDELLVRLREEGVEGRPPILGLSGSLRATLIHLRHNIVQAAIGELLGVSQPTISRAVKALTGANRPNPGGSAAHGRGGAPGVRLRGGRHSLPLLELAQSPRIVVAVSTRRPA